MREILLRCSLYIPSFLSSFFFSFLSSFLFFFSRRNDLVKFNLSIWKFGKRTWFFFLFLFVIIQTDFVICQEGILSRHDRHHLFKFIRGYNI